MRRVNRIVLPSGDHAGKVSMVVAWGVEAGDVSRRKPLPSRMRCLQAILGTA